MRLNPRVLTLYTVTELLGKVAEFELKQMLKSYKSGM
jgi:hypothetical protein